MKIIMCFSLLLICISSFSQIDTTKVEQYCELVAQGKIFSTKVTIDVDFGEERQFFGIDPRVKDEMTGMARKFNSVVDALNYMGQQGWSLINAIPLHEASGSKAFYFYFKKLFLKSELTKNKDL